MLDSRLTVHYGYIYPADMNKVIIKRAKEGYVIETEDALPQIARNLPEALVITASAFEGEEYLPTRVGATIILTSLKEGVTG